MSFLYAMIYPEIACSQEPVFDQDGVQWGGPGRQGSDAPSPVDTWKRWLTSYQKQFSDDYTKIPRYVHEYFQKAKFFSHPPSLQELDYTMICTRYGVKIEFDAKPIEPKEPKKKSFSWSYSALTDFETCPYAYAEKKIFKRVPKEDTDEMIWGQRVHEAMENYLNGKVMDKIIEPYKIYVEGILRSNPDKLLVEHQIAIDRNLKICDWFSPVAWGRGVVDVGVIKDDKIFILDWKTGKTKQDPTQLELFCLFIGIKFPQINTFDPKFIYLKESDPKKAIVSLPAPITRKDLVSIWQRMAPRVKRMEDAVRTLIFQKKTSGLCNGWCPVRDCEHCREKRG